MELKIELEQKRVLSNVNSLIHAAAASVFQKLLHTLDDG